MCRDCKRVVAYLTHGLNSTIKRRFYGESRITHLWPSFEDGDHVFCSECARRRYPNIERATGKSFEKMWKDARDYDHTGDTQFN